MNEMVKVMFKGDELEAIPEGAKVHVGIRRVCEALGIDFSRQLRVLKGYPAIGVVIMSIPSPGGDQETACIELRDLPLWLAKIHPSKVKASVRAKLIAYQREAAEVLADHFFGPRRPTASARDAVYAELGQALASDDADNAARLTYALACLLKPTRAQAKAGESSREARQIERLAIAINHARDLLKTNPGQTLKALVNLSGTNHKLAYEAFRALDQMGEIVNRGTRQRPAYHWQPPPDVQ